MKRNVMIRIRTIRTGISASLFDEELPEDESAEEWEEEQPETAAAPSDEEAEDTELLMEGRLISNPFRVELVYEESELTGMEGSISTVGFDRSAPGLITMLRSGPVSTALVFEEGKRHTCVYDTPFSNFDVCVVTRRVRNDILRSGVLELDYLIEIHGAQAEHCRMTLTVVDDPE